MLSLWDLVLTEEGTDLAPAVSSRHILSQLLKGILSRDLQGSFLVQLLESLKAESSHLYSCFQIGSRRNRGEGEFPNLNWLSFLTLQAKMEMHRSIT